MGDSRGTGCNGKDAAYIFRCAGFRLGCQLIIYIRLLLIRPVDHFQELIHCRRILQVFHEFFIHEQHGKLAQHIKMDIVFRVRCGDQKNKIPSPIPVVPSSSR